MRILKNRSRVPSAHGMIPITRTKRSEHGSQESTSQESQDRHCSRQEQRTQESTQAHAQRETISAEREAISAQRETLGEKSRSQGRARRAQDRSARCPSSRRTEGAAQGQPPDRSRSTRRGGAHCFGYSAGRSGYRRHQLASGAIDRRQPRQQVLSPSRARSTFAVDAPVSFHALRLSLICAANRRARADIFRTRVRARSDSTRTRQSPADSRACCRNRSACLRTDRHTPPRQPAAPQLHP